MITMVLRRFFALAIPLLALLMIVTVVPVDVRAQDSGLPLPRFVSLRAAEVNLRTGPGVQYPVDWIFQRESLPVEIIK